MPDVSSDQYWRTEFTITAEDLDRIANRMRRERVAYTLTELAKRLIRGRLEHGAVDNEAALRKIAGDGVKVQIWDPAKEWHPGDYVIVASKFTAERPLLGQVSEVIDAYVNIRADGIDRVLKFTRAAPRTLQAKQWYEAQQKRIAENYRADTIDERVDAIFEQYPRISGQLFQKLGHDERFVEFENKFYLSELCRSLTDEQITDLHRQMLSAQTDFTIPELLEKITTFPHDTVGEISLYHILSNEKERFEQQDHRWYAIKPPPPPWKQAVGACYVYDPDTSAILLRPGERLTPRIAKRLQELGYYADVVTADDAS